MTKTTLNVEGMSCGGCVARVKTVLNELDGVSDITVNLASETARFSIDHPGRLPGIARSLEQRGYPASTARVTLNIASMSCASCVRKVEKTLTDVPGVLSVNVNLVAGTAGVEYLLGAAVPADFIVATSKIGHSADVAQAQAGPSRIEQKSQDAKNLRHVAVLAAILTLPVFILEMGAHLVPSFHILINSTIGTQTSWVVQFFLTSLVLFGPGRVFFLRGIPALLRAEPDMNSLVALGTGAAWIYSTVATFQPILIPEDARGVYFEAAAMIVVFILIGRWLEARAKGRTGATIEALLGLQVRNARILRGGEILEIHADSLAMGDTVIVRPGERIATDGVITDGTSHVDESMISGEPIPVRKSQGDIIIGGTVNGTGSLMFQATRVGADTTLGQIIRMVEEAQTAKLPIQGLVDKVTLWFVPVIIVLAVLTTFIWLLVGADLSHAMVTGVAVLIIACPCAMGLATPTSIMVGTGRAAEMGVLFRKGDALQQLSDVHVIAFDKTGTLTEGTPTLTDLVVTDQFDRDFVLGLIAAVENHSEHPIAKAIVQSAQDEGINVHIASDVLSVPGRGLLGQVGDRQILIGTGMYMSEQGIDITPLLQKEIDLAKLGRTPFYAAIDGQIAALIAVSDPVKQDSVKVIAALQKQGVQVAMITGDKPETAKAIARTLGIEHVYAGVLPDGKVATLDLLKDGGHTVAFVGDGINDAPALAHADIGIAIGTGTDVAIESADLVLVSGHLQGVLNAVQISRLTMTNIRQNLVWAFGYNIALIPIAAGVLFPAFGLLLSPVFAAAAMALSSVSVLSNSLRLRHISPAPDQQNRPETPFGKPRIQTAQ